ncbi:MAG: thioredoxin domain-containing protein [Bacteroidia bacterium]|nr:thioredoxin domain-containing protein [Bacteroidia bacterium]MDW8301614.1 thioredoxin domain-containing protein [Bacteroidia bacterium]
MKKAYFIIAYLGIFLLACQSQQPGVYNLDAVSFNAKLSEKKNEAIILDVRTPEEFSTGHIEKAQNINYHAPDFQQKINALDKNKPYFVYCLAGGRSSAAAKYMRQNGFKEVYNLSGGISEWQQQGLPIVTQSPNLPTQDKISTQEYQKIIQSKPRVLIDFYAPWCIPCIKMKPFLEELEKEHSQDAAIVRINVEENKNLANQMKVQNIPVLILYEKGKEVWRHQGFIDKPSLKKVLTQKY